MRTTNLKGDLTMTYTVPDAWGRVARMTKTARNRRFHFVVDGVSDPLCGSRNSRDWVTSLRGNVNCPSCLKKLAK